MEAKNATPAETKKRWLPTSPEPQTELTLTILVEPLATALDNCNAGVLKQLAHIVEDTMQNLVEGRLKVQARVWTFHGKFSFRVR